MTLTVETLAALIQNAPQSDDARALAAWLLPQLGAGVPAVQLSEERPSLPPNWKCERCDKSFTGGPLHYCLGGEVREAVRSVDSLRPDEIAAACDLLLRVRAFDQTYKLGHGFGMALERWLARNHVCGPTTCGSVAEGGCTIGRGADSVAAPEEQK